MHTYGYTYVHRYKSVYVLKVDEGENSNIRVNIRNR